MYGKGRRRVYKILLGSSGVFAGQWRSRGQKEKKRLSGKGAKGENSNK